MLLYRLFMACLLPVLLGMTVLGRWPKGTLRERLGRVSTAQGGWWVHGASLGELTSARAVIAGLAAQAPVHVTTNTPTGRALVQGWGLAGVTASFAPFDTAHAPQRLIALLRPRALIVVENEFWPTRLAACRNAAVPVIHIGARMSDRSARRWALAGGLMRPMLQGITYLSAQDAASEARFLALGLPADALGPRINLKAGIAAQTGAAGPVPRARCLLAASTHAGEDAAILDAFAAARGQFDLLILAPRHPARGAEIARLVAGRGLPFGMRSKGAMPQADDAVFLADTTGEMDLWFAMAGATIIGGSFAPKGGHTPYEPASHASALIHGPSVFNFTESFAALAATGGAIAVADGASLATALQGLSPDRQGALAAAARAAFAGGVDVTALVAAILAKSQPKG